MTRSSTLICLLALAVGSTLGAINRVEEQEKASQADSLLPSLLQATRLNFMRPQQSQEQQPREDYYDQAREEDRQQEFRSGFQPRGMPMPQGFQGRFVAPSMANRGQVFVLEGDTYDDESPVRSQPEASQWPAIVRPVAIPRPVHIVDSSTEERDRPATDAPESVASTESPSTPESTAEALPQESTAEQASVTTEEPAVQETTETEAKAETDEVTEAPKDQEKTTEVTEAPKEVTEESLKVTAEESKKEATEVTEQPKEEATDTLKEEESKEETEESKKEATRATAEPEKEETTQAPMDAVESAALPKGDTTATFATPKEEDVVLIDSPTKSKEAKSTEDEPAEDILTTETPEVESEPLRMPVMAGRFTRT